MERMECMEVWGGNQPVDRAFQTTGLDVRVYSRPHAGAQRGGDVYYLSSCASGRITRLLLADVSGHGPAVADLADTLRKLMRRNINYIDQSKLANAVNREFAAVSTSGAFATALIGTYFAPSKTLTIGNAGHPAPLIYRSASGAWGLLARRQDDAREGRNFPLGIEIEQDYSGYKTRLERGDIVVFFTDGLMDLKLTDGSLLGLEGLLRTAGVIQGPDPDGVLHAFRSIPQFEDSISKSDDVSIVVISRNDEHVSFRDNALAPFRVIVDIFKRFKTETA